MRKVPQLPFAEATTLNYATPLIIVVISALFLDETVRLVEAHGGSIWVEPGMPSAVSFSLPAARRTIRAGGAESLSAFGTEEAGEALPPAHVLADDLDRGGQRHREGPQGLDRRAGDEQPVLARVIQVDRGAPWV